MRKKKLSEWFQQYSSQILIYASMCIMYFILYWMQGVVYRNSDYKFHNPSVVWFLEDGILSGYPGYQIIVGALALLLGGVEAVGLSSVIILTFCALISGFITYLILKDLCSAQIHADLQTSVHWDSLLLLAAFLINIVQPIFLPSIKPGYTSGNGYVSPTQLLCKPFALMSVLVFTKQLHRNDWRLRTQSLLVLLIGLSCLSKPLFAMAFVPSMGLLLAHEEFRAMLLGRHSFIRFIQQTLRKGWPLIISGILLIIQYLICIQLKLPDGAFLGIDKDSHIRFGWMTAWSLVVASVPLSLIFAFFFPLVTFIASIFRKRSMHICLLPYTKVCLYYGIISFLYMSCLYQENHVTDANLRNGWVLTFNLVFILSTATLLDWIKSDHFFFSLSQLRVADAKGFLKANWSIIIPLCSFGIHILFGLALIIKNYLT